MELLERIKTKIEDSEQENGNFFLSNPYSQNLTNLDIFIRTNSVDHETKLNSINRLKKLALNEKNFNSFSIFLDSFLNESKYEWLIQGNITKEEALDIVDSTQNILIKNVLETKDISPIKIARLEKKQNFYYNFLSKDEKNLNSSLISYFQAGNLNDRDLCKLFILESLFREKFFDDLRTKRALGYIVRLGIREHRDVNGVFCLVQSSERSPEYLHDVINEFLAKPEFENINDETYNEHVRSVIDELSKKDLKLDEEASRNFNEIKSKNYKFDKKRIYIETLKQIKFEEVKELYERIFSSELKRLDIALLAHCHLEENNNYEIENNKKMIEKGIQRIKVESPNEFKRIISIYPDFFHHKVKSYPKF
jgi:secreted Zn-dependent insulinase-like peptidase